MLDINVVATRAGPTNFAFGFPNMQYYFVFVKMGGMITIFPQINAIILSNNLLFK